MRVLKLAYYILLFFVFYKKIKKVKFNENVSKTGSRREAVSNM